MSGAGRIDRSRHPLVRYRRLGLLYVVLRSELWTPGRARLPWPRRLRAWRLGFDSATWKLYELDRNDPREYLRPSGTLDFQFRQPQALSVNDKFLFPQCLQALGLPHPRLFGYVHRGAIHPPGGGRQDLAIWLAAAPPRRLVFKPVDGLGGSGILMVDLPIQPAELETLRELRRYVVTEFAEQAPYAAALFPGTTNTVRLLTLWDDARDEPFIAAAAQRLGRPGCEPIDNFKSGRGGLSAPIDLTTGELGLGAGVGADGGVHRYERHPQTGAPLAGVRVAGWSEVVELALRAARAVPQSPFIGWDLVVTNGGPVVLEANTPPGVNVWQVNAPLLRDPRVRRSLAALGVV